VDRPGSARENAAAAHLRRRRHGVAKKRASGHNERASGRVAVQLPREDGLGESLPQGRNRREEHERTIQGEAEHCGKPEAELGQLTDPQDQYENSQ
jgi:hypothetical protein